MRSNCLLKALRGLLFLFQYSLSRRSWIDIGNRRILFSVFLTFFTIFIILFGSMGKVIRVLLSCRYRWFSFNIPGLYMTREEGLAILIRKGGPLRVRDTTIFGFWSNNGSRIVLETAKIAFYQKVICLNKLLGLFLGLSCLLYLVNAASGREEPWWALVSLCNWKCFFSSLAFYGYTAMASLGILFAILVRFSVFFCFRAIFGHVSVFRNFDFFKIFEEQCYWINKL